MRRAIIVLLSTLGLLGLSASQPQAAESVETLTRVQLRVETTSDWTSVRFAGADIRVERVSEATVAERVWKQPAGFTVVAEDHHALLIADLVLEVPVGASPSITVEKGRWGATDVTLVEANGTDTSVAASLTLDTQDPEVNRLTRSLDRDLVVGSGVPIPELDQRNLVLAFYYPWFDEADAFDRRIAPDKPGSAFATNDDAHVAAMVAEAAGAGIDGFVVSWQGDLHAEVVDKLFSAIRAHPDFLVAPLLELREMKERTLLAERFDPERAAAALRSFLGRADPDALLRVDGRPVVVTHGMWELSPDEWARFLAATVDLDVFVVGDHLDRMLPVDGIHLYDPNSRSVGELVHDYERFVDRARLRPALDPGERQMLWAATVSPGFDNRSSRLIGRRSTSRADGQRYEDTWTVATATEPEWVFVTSWNEWYEQTHVAPGTTTGRRALEQTAQWSARFALAGDS